MAFDPRAALALLIPCLAAHSAELANLSSPDGANVISVHLDEDGRPSYQVSRRGRVLLDHSPLGLKCSDQDFSRLTLETIGETRERADRYELFAGPKPRVDQLHREMTLVLKNSEGSAIHLDLDAGNEGVAFRYRFPEKGAERVVENELTGFHLPDEARGWISPYNVSSNSSPAYEDYYVPVKPGDPPPDSRGGKTRGWYFPALFQVQGSWALLTESGTDANYCGCHLAPGSTDGIYRVAFPFDDEGTRRVRHRESTLPRHALPWTMPWRVIVMADSAGGILTSTMVTDVAAPSKIADTSWIKPGRASWSWWAHPEGRNGTELYAEYLGMTKTRGWEHSLLDAGWWKADAQKLAALATEQGTGLHVWSHAEGFYDSDRRKRQLDSYVELGVKGTKIDFWCSDRQETLEAMAATLRDAAERKLMVNFHGCTLPRGWHRTWPNFMTAEAVLGAESYMFDERYPEKAAELNTILPFTRNVAGPMDYTPLGLSEKCYRRMTTAAHELAASLIFTSGIIHYADKPEVYAAFPEEARAVLRDAPARWDDTRCLIGEPGRLVVLARKAGDTWFIAGINGTSAEIPVELDPSTFAGFSRATLIREGKEPRMELSAQPANAAAKWAHTMPARGGFVLRLDK